jgi:hypothetical protein
MKYDQGIANLRAMLARADKHDISEGMLAYARYNMYLRYLADVWGQDFERTVAAFCALSPNNDYVGNLRSLVSALQGMKEGWTSDMVTVSTYRACLRRAWRYLHGVRFLDDAKGLKIRSFYMNIVNPLQWSPVTVDGHISAAWRGDDKATMKDAIIKSKREYETVAAAVREIAFAEFMVPNQLQAILWFARKRSLKIMAELQHDLFFPGDVWRVIRGSNIQPFPRRDRQ